MSRIKSNFDYLFVIIYFTGTIFFQTKLSENVLLNIHGNTKFWDTYFEIIMVFLRLHVFYFIKIKSQQA